jgi:hypothetical protein
MKAKPKHYTKMLVHPSGVKVLFTERSDGTVEIETIIPDNINPKIASLFQSANDLLILRHGFKPKTDIHSS